MKEIQYSSRPLKICATLAIAALAAGSFTVFFGNYYQMDDTTIQIRKNVLGNVDKYTTAKAGNISKAQISTITPNITKKKLLFWTQFYGRPWGDMHGLNVTTLKCHDHVCDLAQNSPHLAEHYDALVFHTRDGHKLKLLSEKIPRRNPKQIYIAWSMEPPTHQGGYVKGDNFYNWSVATHGESTVQARYGGITKLNNSQIISANELFEKLRTMNPAIGKGKAPLKLFGVISHCTTFSKREEYIKELKKHVPVDIFGGCGTKIVPKIGKAPWGTYLLEKAEYKFYLSFENSACKDYITEKLYYNAFKFGLVPIVYGGLSKEDYAKPGVLPPHSYIDTRDFKSPKELVKYLEVLNKNDALYLRYHAWRRNYKIKQEKDEHWLCGLCHALHNTTLTSKSTRLNWAKLMNINKLCDLELHKKLVPGL